LTEVDGALVALSPPSPADAGEFIEAVVASHSLHYPWLDAPDSPARFTLYLERARSEDQLAFLLRHQACGQLIGFVNVNSIVRGGFQSGYLGYGAFASHAGRGLMTEGLRAVVSVAFADHGLHRLEANIQPANARSIALVRRLGFQKEGFSPRYLRIDGDWRDHERWALLADDWAG
jgi:[ribosomal protein S5]-alanine N-acetyltransferase